VELRETHVTHIERITGSNRGPAAAPGIVPAPALPAPERMETSLAREQRENRLFLAEAAPAPAPTIHVTIGRIEIRATPAAPAPARPAAPRPPGMSLDDYLRRRDGDGRAAR
jgi:hypothetical protein